jgi:hypothetical protein
MRLQPFRFVDGPIELFLIKPNQLASEGQSETDIAILDISPFGQLQVKSTGVHEEDPRTSLMRY